MEDYKYLGNFSAVDPAYSRDMTCYDCEVRWTGCWDNFQCPKCDRGDLPSADPIRNMENSEVKFPTTDPVMALLVEYNKNENS
jgi:hypothetical protein